MAQTCKQKKKGASDRCCPGLTDLMAPQFFKALCDPNRIAILSRLAQFCGPMKVGDVADCCTVDMSVVSRHLSVLRDAGIVEAEKRGKEVFYRVRYGAVAGALRRIADAIEACCPENISKENHNE